MRRYVRKLIILIRRLQFSVGLIKRQSTVLTPRYDAPYNAVVYGLEPELWEHFDNAYPEFRKTFVPNNIHVAELRNLISPKTTALIVRNGCARRRLDLASSGMTRTTFNVAPAPIFKLVNGDDVARGFLLDSMGNWELARRTTEADIMLQSLNLDTRQDLVERACALLEATVSPIAGDTCLVISTATDEAARGDTLTFEEQAEFEEALIAHAKGKPVRVFRPEPFEEFGTEDNWARFVKQLKGCDTVVVKDSALGLLPLLLGCKVIVTGRPFWAGYGLTEDMRDIDRHRSLSRSELAAILLGVQCRYSTDAGVLIDPLAGWTLHQ